MPHAVDLAQWPLVHAKQGGRMTVEDASALAEGLRAALARSADEGVRFAIVVDQRERGAPQKGAVDVLGGFWTGHQEQISERCVGVAAIVELQSLVEASADEPTHAGVAYVVTTDPAHAATWASDQLAREA